MPATASARNLNPANGDDFTLFFCFVFLFSFIFSTHLIKDIEKDTF